MVIEKENQSWVSQLMIAFDYHGVKFVKMGVGISTISYNWIAAHLQ
jgi:hypothetical protein